MITKVGKHLLGYIHGFRFTLTAVILGLDTGTLNRALVLFAEATASFPVLDVVLPQLHLNFFFMLTPWNIFYN